MRNHVQDIQVLALVFMDTFDLHVEHRVRVDNDARLVLHQGRELAFVVLLDVSPLALEGAIARKRLEFA